MGPGSGPLLGSQHHAVQALSAAMKVERRLAQRIKGSSAAAGVKASDASRKHGNHMGFTRAPLESVQTSELCLMSCEALGAIYIYKRLCLLCNHSRKAIRNTSFCTGAAVPAESSESEEDEDLGRAGAILRKSQPAAQAWSQAEHGKTRKRKKGKKQKLGNGQ